MVQSAFLFAFGAFSAILLCLLIAPAVWRRAVYLTQKRIESAVPLTVNELQADKDRLRAEHAIAIQKIEGTLKQHRAEYTLGARKVAELETEISNLEEKATQREAVVRELRDKLADIERDRLTLEEASDLSETEKLAISAELAARVTELELVTIARDEYARKAELLEDKVAAATAAEVKHREAVENAREKRKEEQEKTREARRELAEVTLETKAERDRVKELEVQLSKSESQVSELAKTLESRDLAIERIQDDRTDEMSEMEALQRRAEDAEADREALESEVAEMTIRVNRIAAALDAAGDPEDALEAMQERITKLEAELDRELAQRDEAGRQAKADTERGGDAAVLEEMHALAAQVLNMAAMLEGDDSEVADLVRQGSNGTSTTDGTDKPLSLAERVVALQEAAAPKKKTSASAKH